MTHFSSITDLYDRYCDLFGSEQPVWSRDELLAWKHRLGKRYEEMTPEDLAAAYDESVTAADAQEEAVSLHEDNAGRLYLWRAGAASGYDVTPIIDQQPGLFEEHAVALLDGETADWTVEQVPAAQIAEIPVVATYDGQQGRVHVVRDEYSGVARAGSAARLFIGPLDYVTVSAAP